MPDQPDIIDLCAGIGWAEGLTPLGLHETGLELNPIVCATRKARGHHTVHGDITQMIPATFRSARKIIGFPPCPGFGKSGRKLGLHDLPRVYQVIDDLAHGRDTRAALNAACLDPRSILTAEPMRWLHALRPEWVVMEQVPSVLPVWKHYARILDTWGYSTATAVLDAADHGLGQHRPRAIIIASRTRPAAMPAATHGPGLLPHTTMASVTGWGYTQRPAPTVTGGGTATGGAEPFGNGTRQAMRKAIGTSAWAHRDIPPTRNGSPNLRPTITECAALQGFDPDLAHDLQGGAGDQHLLIGNAVPPLLATHIVAAAEGLTVPQPALAAA
ncbi:DNA cytosine methyltransferase [Streptomyces sp. NPDC056529]|uniref:DNA cytosine methyltransferase n=1 Tax=Streptomyces sp. NPDC056529 TaxID=3345855 RepID=UPI00367A15D4